IMIHSGVGVDDHSPAYTGSGTNNRTGHHRTADSHLSGRADPGFGVYNRHQGNAMLLDQTNPLLAHSIITHSRDSAVTLTSHLGNIGDLAHDPATKCLGHIRPGIVQKNDRLPLPAQLRRLGDGLAMATSTQNKQRFHDSLHLKPLNHYQTGLACTPYPPHPAARPTAG